MTTAHARTVIRLAAVVLILLVPRTSAAVGVVFEPALALVDHPTSPRIVAIAASGTGFGTPVAGSSTVQVENTGLPTLYLTWPTPEILAWRDTHVAVSVPTSYLAASVRVVAAGSVASNLAAVAYYRYEAFKTGTVQDDAPPTALSTDQSGNAWIDSEFHTQLKRVDATTGAVTGISIPYPTTNFIFCGSNITPLAEEVIVDELGGVWFTEGGASPGCTTPTAADHSRIVRYDPGSLSFKVFNVPGDRNGVMGLAYDQPNHRMWYTITQRGGCLDAGGHPTPCRHAGIGSFDTLAAGLACAPTDACFSFPTAACSGTPLRCANNAANLCEQANDCALVDRLCTAGGSPCFSEYSIDAPGGGELQPAHVAIGSDAAMWVTNYWGTNSLGRLDPTNPSGVQRFPLPAPTSSLGCNQLLLGAGPWEIVTDPAGDVVFTESLNNGIGRFDVGLQTSLDCEHLNGSGQNPCVTIANPPGDQAHGLGNLVIDSANNVWFIQGGPLEDPAATTSLGYLKGGDWTAKQVLLFPPLSVFARSNPGGEILSSGGGEVAVHHNLDGSDTIWFTTFLRGEIVHLKKI